MPDGVFLERVGLPAEAAPAVLAIRTAIASQCGVPPESIYDTDDCDRLASTLTFDGWDAVVFVVFLQENLGITIPDNMAAMPLPGTLRVRNGAEDCSTVAEWIRTAAPRISELLT